MTTTTDNQRAPQRSNRQVATGLNTVPRSLGPWVRNTTTYETAATHLDNSERPPARTTEVSFNWVFSTGPYCTLGRSSLFQ
ncbi:hypothetical protein TWF281_000138 [Arthrobotrys megalospora]